MIQISYINRETLPQVILETISLLRFPLILGVLLLHTFIIDENVLGSTPYQQGVFPFLEGVEYFIKRGFGDLCVPSFFVISGYLFFRKSTLDKADYLRKMRSRIRTLIVPYFFWNTLFIIFVGVIEVVYPTLVGGERKYIWEFTISDWGNAYWDLSQGLIPLWYIRDLVIINLFAPLIYFFIKRTSFFILILFLAMWFLGIFVYTNGIGLRSTMFYTLGAYIAISKPKIPLFNRGVKLVLLIIYLSLLCVSTLLYINGENIFLLNQFSVLYGVILLLIFSVNFQNQYHFKVSSRILQSCFFIYVFHMFVIYFPDKLFLYVLPANTFCGILLLVLVPTFTSIICIYVYDLIRYLLPALSRFIVGDR